MGLCDWLNVAFVQTNVNLEFSKENSMVKLEIYIIDYLYRQIDYV